MFRCASVYHSLTKNTSVYKNYNKFSISPVENISKISAHKNYSTNNTKILPDKTYFTPKRQIIRNFQRYYAGGRDRGGGGDEEYERERERERQRQRGGDVPQTPEEKEKEKQKILAEIEEEYVQVKFKMDERKDEEESKYGGTIGVDLGTTNSVVATYENRKLRILENSEGNRTTPSVVAWAEDGEKMVGISAKRQRIVNPKRSLYATKRVLGLQFSDSTVKKHKENVSYEITENRSNGQVQFLAGDKTVSPKEVATSILVKMKETTEKHFGKPPSLVTIGVPSNYSANQRQIVLDAARDAGFNSARLMNEPTAALLAYGYTRDEEGIYVVYDLGGGTFDCSIMRARNGIFEMAGSGGDPFLGGEDFDAMIFKKFINDFKKKNKIDLTEDPVAVQRLRDSIENAKIELSSTIKTAISIPFITITPDGTPLHFSTDFSRSQFERITDDLFERTKIPCKKAIRDANIEISEIDAVIAVGGMSKTSRVNELIQEIFNQIPIETPISPDEAVAMGCAIMSELMVGSISNLTLIEISPLPIGIEVEGGYFVPIIPRNSKLPARATKVFSNAMAVQDYAKIKIYQGDRELAASNRFLGEFIIGPFPRMARGMNRVFVTCDLELDGTLKVKAEEPYTQNEFEVEFDRPNVSPHQDLIEQVVERSQDMAEEDFLNRETEDLYTMARREVERANANLLMYKSHYTYKNYISLTKAISNVELALKKRAPFLELRYFLVAMRKRITNRTVPKHGLIAKEFYDVDADKVIRDYVPDAPVRKRKKKQRKIVPVGEIKYENPHPPTNPTKPIRPTPFKN